MEVINVYVHLDGKDVFVMKVSFSRINKFLDRDFLFYFKLEIEITIPHFNRQSYLELKSLVLINNIDLTFTTERRNGLILYSNNKLNEFDFIISIRNKIIEIM
jgi:hypothetical protein